MAQANSHLTLGLLSPFPRLRWGSRWKHVRSVWHMCKRAAIWQYILYIIYIYIYYDKRILNLASVSCHNLPENECVKMFFSESISAISGLCNWIFTSSLQRAGNQRPNLHQPVLHCLQVWVRKNGATKWQPMEIAAEVAQSFDPNPTQPPPSPNVLKLAACSAGWLSAETGPNNFPRKSWQNGDWTVLNPWTHVNHTLSKNHGSDFPLLQTDIPHYYLENTDTAPREAFLWRAEFCQLCQIAPEGRSWRSDFASSLSNQIGISLKDGHHWFQKLPCSLFGQWFLHVFSFTSFRQNIIKAQRSVTSLHEQRRCFQVRQRWQLHVDGFDDILEKIPVGPTGSQQQKEVGRLQVLPQDILVKWQEKVCVVQNQKTFLQYLHCSKNALSRKFAARCWHVSSNFNKRSS